MSKHTISKKAKMLAAAAFVIGVTTIGAGLTYAAVQNPGTHHNALVEAIATKFNLSTTDVQKVIDEVMTKERTQMQADHEAKFTERINTAVTDGKLTAEQGALIIAKAKEVKAFMESLKDKTQAERETAMKTEMASIKQWLTDNNIPKDYSLFIGFGGKEHGMDRGPRSVTKK